VIRKREKRTGTRRGLGNLLSLEIDDRAHDVRTGSRQKCEEKLAFKTGQGAGQRGRVGMWRKRE